MCTDLAVPHTFLLTGTMICSDREARNNLLLFPSAAATEEPEVIPDPAKQTDRVVKIAGISAGILVFILLLLLVILIVKKRYVF